MFSKIVRRTHMYLALFLSPWVVMYAVTTMVMNREHAHPLSFEKVRELTYDGTLPADNRLAARQLLNSLGLEGAHNAPPRRADGTLVVQRQSIGTVYRVTHRAADNYVLVEKAAVRGANLMHSLHRRRGYQHPYALDDAWAFSVDLFVAATILWALSGLWMWWELKVTRALGLLALAAGAAIFAFFLVVL
jgi:hypothetical protein